MKKYQQSYFVLILLCILFVIYGCAGSKSLSPDDKKTINTIAIEYDDISYKDSKDLIMLNTSASGWSAALGGPIGAILYDGLHDDTPEGTFLYLLKKDDMLKKTVADSFRHQIIESKVFGYEEKDKADAFFHIEVGNIQLHELNGNKLKLTSIFIAKLISTKDNRILWQGHDFFSGFNDELVEYTMDEYFSNPTKFRYAISVVSQMLAREFMKDLGGTAVPVDHNLHKVQDVTKNIATTSEQSGAQLQAGQNAGADTSSDIENKMTRLKKMYEDQLITKEEYDLKRKAILDRM